MKYFFAVIYCFLLTNYLFAQSSPPKHLKAHRIQESISIDGKLEEAAWQNAPLANEFIERFPNPSVLSAFHSEVKVLYDDNALYIGAILHDPQPDSILKELGNRDAGENNADLFGVMLDTYWDKQNAFEFTVSASSVQTDGRISQHEPDYSWNAVWANHCRITKEGWVVEMKIPYSAIRFADKPAQTWGINFYRIVRRVRQKSFWNEINPKVLGLVNQYGVLEGIENIKPPFRLMFFPYISSYLQYQDKQWKPNFRGGADVKMGLNESFTLDMTLIPDFGQVQTDNVVYNLTPFEVKFQDYRPFFTEGVDLFNKSPNLFYSRRVGGRPMEKDNVSYNDSTHQLLSNPATTQLINASKISGRTAKKLGVGFLNAISAPTYAVLEDKFSHKKENVMTNPLTNYNMIVLDQPFWNNSYATFINTNVMRAGDFRDANVTGAMFKIADKKNSYAVLPNAYLSYIKDPRNLATNKPEIGYAYDITAGKFNGKHRFLLQQKEVSDKYNCNDLGYLSNNSESKTFAYYQYNQLEPKGKINTANVSISTELSHYFRANQRHYSAFKIHTNGFFYFKNFLAAGFEGEYYPFKNRDYFSPRITRDSAPPYASLAQAFWHHIWISTDYRKKFAIDAGGGTFHTTTPYLIADTSDKIFILSFWNNANLRYRFSDKFTLRYDWDAEWNKHEVNWATFDADNQPIYGKRNTRRLTHVLTATYNFTRRMSLSFRTRHYHLGVKYDYYLDLMANGNYRYHPNFGSNQDFNYNALTADFLYAWEFTAGSLLTVNWKQQIYHYGSDFLPYPNSFASTFQQQGISAFSVKLMYFLDAQSLKKKKITA